MRKNQSLLDPMCPVCGNYKGVGLCKDESCSFSQSDLGFRFEDKDRRTIVKEGGRVKCAICKEDAIVICTTCEKGYCDVHSIGYEENQFKGIQHRIGTCSVCGRLVCENCWFSDAGELLCLIHLEE